MMCGIVLEHLDTYCTKIEQKRVFLYPNALFRPPNFQMNCLARTHPITSIGPKTMFGSDLERFGTRMHAKQCETGPFRFSDSLPRSNELQNGFFASDTSNLLA